MSERRGTEIAGAGLVVEGGVCIDSAVCSSSLLLDLIA